MNIMLFSKKCGRTGVGGHMRQLAESMVDQGHRVWIVSSSNEQRVEESKGLHFVLLPVTTKNPIQVIRNLWKLRTLIKNNRIDVVHCHYRLAALYMEIYRFFWEVPVVYTLHLTPIPHDLLHRKLTYAGDHAIAVSTEIKEFMIDKLRIPSENIDVVLNGVYPPDKIHGGGDNRSKILRKYNIPDAKFILLMNSRIAEVKNHLLMVEAVAHLPKEIQDRIVVVCTGEKSGQYFKTVLQKIEQYSLQDMFSFVGWVDPYEILAVSDFLFLPSKAEGFPLTCVEAFFMKVPVARTKTGGFEDMKEFCIPLSDTDYRPINDVIVALVKKGKGEFEELAENAYQWAWGNLTVQAMTKKTLDIYRSVLKKLIL